MHSETKVKRDFTPVLSSSLLSSSSLEYAAFVRRFCVTFIQKKKERFEIF